MPTRTFTLDELAAIGVPFHCGGDGAAEELRRKRLVAGWWGDVFELVFRAPDDGRAWQVHYERPLPGAREIEPFDGDTVTAVEMEHVDVTVKAWRPRITRGGEAS